MISLECKCFSVLNVNNRYVHVYVPVMTIFSKKVKKKNWNKESGGSKPWYVGSENGLEIYYCSFHISLSKVFWRVLFYFYLFLAETFMICVNVFYITRNKISAWSDNRQIFSPYTPIIKIVHFCNVMSIDMMLQKWAIFIMGVYGEISNFCWIQLKFCFWLYTKHWHTS